MKAPLVLSLLVLAGCAAGRDATQDRAFEADSLAHGLPADPAREEALATAPTLELAQEEAVARNPDLVVALERWAQFLERAPQKYGLANPMLGYSYNSMFRMHELGSALLVPFPSKLAAEANAALAEARAAGADWKERENRLRAEAASAYANLWLAERQLAIVDENLVLLARFIEIAEGKLKAGTGTLPDTLRAQVERDGLRADRASLAREVEIARSALNVLLDRSPVAPLGPLTSLPAPVPSAPRGSLLDEALARRPALTAATERIEAAEQTLSRSRLEWLPDFQVGAAYIRDQGTEHNFAQFGAGLSLPIFFGPIRARIREAEAMSRGARAELRATRNRVLDEVRVAELRVEAARERWEILTRDALPRVESAIRASEAAYVAKQIEFSALVDTERQLLTKKLERERALAEYTIARAELERATGGHKEGR